VFGLQHSQPSQLRFAGRRLDATEFLAFMGMALYGIFFIYAAPLLPVLVAVTIHPLFDLKDAREKRKAATSHPTTASAPAAVPEPVAATG